MSRAIGETMQTMASRARLFRKIMVSLAIGTLAYVITNLLAETADEPQLIGLTLSVFIGGATLVIQVLVDFERRLVGVEDSHESHAEHMEDLVKAGFAKINEATELFSLVEASALHTDVVLELVRHSTQIKASAPRLVLAFAQAEIGRTSQFVKELSEGSNVSYDGEDRDWMLALARNVQSSIDATSLSTVDAGGRGWIDEGLWHSDLGQRYLEVQRQAIENGVRIRRAFIIDQSELATDPGFLEICRVQREVGIEVRILDSSAMPGLRRTSLFDFILFDDVVSYEVTPATLAAGSVRRAIVNTRIELRPERVRDRIQRFKDLWALAHEPE
ncbi:phosphatidylserine/phosphatidylglycerophosphate/cardiolipin synthase family protein [Rhizomonospora bruguierae]|uniref:phosphatidylserine/phosphatidylglycerophosphate/ cardiolipin synthase family protein n=1 Tax=Rhizomonospora bruguierae TaxID=1581705 RepID=UPI001BCBA760|nr:phosphatidylserine/phosphatidylglycerophosphate/cardiolipin synthase family protein [Micromonospora sp. NBRC 107566]